MERRVILAVVLTMAVIYLSNLLFPSAEPPVPDGVVDSTLVESLPPIESRDTATTQVAPSAPVEELRVAESVTGDTVQVLSSLFDLRFTTVGATLVSAELLEYESYAENGGTGRPVQLVREGDALLGYRIVVGGDTVSVDDRIFRASRSKISLSREQERDSVVFRYAFPSGGAELVITYGFRFDSYLVDVSGRLEGVGDRGYSILTSLGQGLRTNEKNPGDDYGQLGFVVRGERSGIRSVKLDAIDPGEVRPAAGGPFDWVGVKNKYFLVAFVSPADGPDFGGFVALGMPAEHAAQMTASLPVPAGSEGFAFSAYVGPQEYRRLEAVGHDRDLEHANPYGWRWMRPIIRPLVGIVMIVLTWMHEFLGLAYGWVLILFGVAMRVVLFPLYQKSMRAQLAQMQVQPLMKELQAKYKDDPQKLQSEMLKLYKEHNVNPLAGCLPMLLPMPILFALFFVFQSTIEFRGVPFLWLPDLSLKDPLYIIPLLMGASMFVLSWIGQRGMEANPQMKMMTYVMPVVFTVLFANFPSGLNLYYATSNLASLPQQLYLSRERTAARARVQSEKTERKAGAGTDRRDSG